MLSTTNGGSMIGSICLNFGDQLAELRSRNHLPVDDVLSALRIDVAHFP